MDTQTKLLKSAQELKLARTKPKLARNKLLKRGWTIKQINQAMWQAGYRDWDSAMSIRRIKRLTIVCIILAIIAILLGITLIIEKQNDQLINSQPASDQAEPENTSESDPQNANQLKTQTVNSKPANISFEYPDDWLLTDFSSPDQPDQYVWQIEPSTNNAINAELQKRYEELLSDDSQGIGALAVLDDPLVAQLVTVNIAVSKEPTNTIESSLEEWESNHIKQQDVPGYSSSELNNVVIDGVEGYAFIANLEIRSTQISSLEYVFIRSDSKVEISIYPEQSNYQSIINYIINSLKL